MDDTVHIMYIENIILVRRSDNMYPLSWLCKIVSCERRSLECDATLRNQQDEYILSEQRTSMVFYLLYTVLNL